MEVKIGDLEFFQAFKYNYDIWYVLPHTRCQHTWAIKRTGGAKKEFPNDFIVKI